MPVVRENVRVGPGAGGGLKVSELHWLPLMEEAMQDAAEALAPKEGYAVAVTPEEDPANGRQIRPE